MNLSSFKKNVIGKHYIGVEHFSFENEEKIAVLQTENKNGELLITKKDKVTYLGFVPEKWNKKLPLFLVLNTNQVLHKEVMGADIVDEKLLFKAFPNTNLEEFYFEIWRSNNRSLVALSRKNYVDDIVSVYKQQGILIAGISLGVCGLVEISDYITIEEVVTNHQIISWRDDDVMIKTLAFENEETLQLNGLSINSSQLLSFCGILRLINQSTHNTGGIIAYSNELYENHIQQSLFSVGLKVMLTSLFLLLFFNFIAFSHYYSLASEASENIILNKASDSKISNIKQRVVMKEQKVKNALSDNFSESSVVINEIARRIPSSILLSGLIYHPLVKEIKDDEQITVNNKTILISGKIMENKAFTKWIESVELLKQVDNVVITHFGKNDMNETEFSVKLTLK
jgi:hypothetical protein